MMTQKCQEWGKKKKDQEIFGEDNWGKVPSGKMQKYLRRGVWEVNQEYIKVLGKWQSYQNR